MKQAFFARQDVKDGIGKLYDVSTFKVNKLIPLGYGYYHKEHLIVNDKLKLTDILNAHNAFDY